jgi:hypothetical protein
MRQERASPQDWPCHSSAAAGGFPHHFPKPLVHGEVSFYRFDKQFFNDVAIVPRRTIGDQPASAGSRDWVVVAELRWASSQAWNMSTDQSLN